MSQVQSRDDFSMCTLFLETKGMAMRGHSIKNPRLRLQDFLLSNFHQILSKCKT